MQNIDKEEIRQTLIDFIIPELEAAKKAVKETKDLISQDDMKPEGKYDTRRTEAQYLAGALAKRVEELTTDFNLLTNLEFPKENKKVSIGSIVTCLHNEKEQVIFITPSSGGKPLKINGILIHLSSPTSPLGDSIIALEQGDFFEVESPRGDLEYEILAID